jgi:hypothetical protein
MKINAATPPRRRALLTIGLLLFGLPVAVSYSRAVLRAGHSNVQLRTGLWLRDHGLSGPVDLVEWCWYTLRRRHALQGEKPRPPALPVEELTSSMALDAPLPPPQSMPCRQRRCDADEGTWQPAGARVEGAPAIYVSYFRPDAAHTRVWAAAALMDGTRLRALVVAGTSEPRDFRGAWGGEIPRNRRKRLIAAFNGGFRFADAAGGFYAEGRTALPLRDDAASLVVYRSGRADVGAWGRDLHMARDVMAVRQNLLLIVDAGRVVRGVDRNEHGEWGVGRNQGLYTWRSGLGVRADGALNYVAGDWRLRSSKSAVFAAWSSTFTTCGSRSSSTAAAT